MISRRSQDHSMLEIMTNPRFTHENPPLQDPGMQVLSSDEKQVNFQKTGLEVVLKEQDPSQYPAKSDARFHRPRQPRRKWLLCAGIAALLIVLAAVLGGVFGSRARNKSPSGSSSTSSPPGSSSTSSPFISSTASNTMQSQHNIAAFSFAVNSVDNTRVYYQDNSGEIIEAANSAKNSTWINTRLGFFAQNGSAIAAAVSRPGFTHVSADIGSN